MKINYNAWIAKVSLAKLVRREEAGSNLIFTKHCIIETDTSLNQPVGEYIRENVEIYWTSK